MSQSLGVGTVRGVADSTAARPPATKPIIVTGRRRSGPADLSTPQQVTIGDVISAVANPTSSVAGTPARISGVRVPFDGVDSLGLARRLRRALAYGPLEFITVGGWMLAVARTQSAEVPARWLLQVMVHVPWRTPGHWLLATPLFAVSDGLEATIAAIRVRLDASLTLPGLLAEVRALDAGGHLAGLPFTWVNIDGTPRGPVEVQDGLRQLELLCVLNDLGEGARAAGVWLWTQQDWAGTPAELAQAAMAIVGPA